jgi:hypothetical protein
MSRDLVGPVATIQAMGEEMAVAPPQPQANPQPHSSNRAQLAVSMAILALVAVMLGLQVYWKYFELRWDGLAEDVLTSMNQYLKSDSRYSEHSPNVSHITVIHAAENTFEGQATVTASGVSARDVIVHIVYDGDTMFWSTDPGAFLFLAMSNT